MRRAIPYPFSYPSTSIVFKTINANVPCGTSVFCFMAPPFWFPTGRWHTSSGKATGKWSLAFSGGGDGVGFGGGGAVSPEFWRRHYEFDGYLRLAHEAGAQASNSAKQLFLGVDVLDVNDLLDVNLGSHQDQRTV